VDEAGIEAALREAGAHEVKLEAIVVTTARVRSEGIATAQSTADKVEEFWKVKGITVDEPTRDRVRSKLGELEAVR
jgi:hypothetical protein